MRCEGRSPGPDEGDSEGRRPVKSSSGDGLLASLYDQPRHIQYATHFPIPQVGLDSVSFLFFFMLRLLFSALNFLPCRKNLVVMSATSG